MRILAFSDLHRNKDTAARIVAASRNADVIVGAGDFATRGVGLSDTLNILVACDAPLLVVSGNHDPSEELRAVCEAVPHFTYLDGNCVSIGDQTFFGIGREIPFQKDAGWNEAYSETQARELLKDVPHRAILISHAPPFGLVDLQPDGRHQGSKALLEAIEHKSPLFHLCGHIHYCNGKSTICSKTKVMNLGPSLTWIDC